MQFMSREIRKGVNTNLGMMLPGTLVRENTRIKKKNTVLASLYTRLCTGCRFTLRTHQSLSPLFFFSPTELANKWKRAMKIRKISWHKTSKSCKLPAAWALIWTSGQGMTARHEYVSSMIAHMTEETMYRPRVSAENQLSFVRTHRVSTCGALRLPQIRDNFSRAASQ